MSVPLSAAVTLGLLFFLSVGLNEQVAEGCSCVQKDVHQAFCDSDTVIRAKITGRVTNAQRHLVEYSIKLIKTFKHVGKRPIWVIYSHSCEVHLENEEYLLSGNVEDGMVFVSLCDLVKRWDDVSSAEKEYLRRCQRGCNCGIVPWTSCWTQMP